LGIDLGDFNIPFQTEGNTIYFESRVPTTEEMENCQYISLTDDEDWDPAAVNLQDYMTKEILFRILKIQAKVPPLVGNPRSELRKNSLSP
jgi:hypothetical protein